MRDGPEDRLEGLLGSDDDFLVFLSRASHPPDYPENWATIEERPLTSPSMDGGRRLIVARCRFVYSRQSGRGMDNVRVIYGVFLGLVILFEVTESSRKRYTGSLSNMYTILPESISRPLPAQMAQSRNLVLISLEIPVLKNEPIRRYQLHYLLQIRRKKHFVFLAMETFIQPSLACLMTELKVENRKSPLLDLSSPLLIVTPKIMPLG